MDEEDYTTITIPTELYRRLWRVVDHYDEGNGMSCYDAHHLDQDTSEFFDNGPATPEQIQDGIECALYAHVEEKEFQIRKKQEETGRSCVHTEELEAQAENLGKKMANALWRAHRRAIIRLVP